jgi:hypothetical protein
MLTGISLGTSNATFSELRSRGLLDVVELGPEGAQPAEVQVSVEGERGYW